MKIALVQQAAGEDRRANVDAGLQAVREAARAGAQVIAFAELAFERFYRADKARSRELGGTGLGLSIVKHLAQSFGGRVSVDSRPGDGSTFAIRLPLATAERV